MIGFIILPYHDGFLVLVTLITRLTMSKEACRQMMKDIRERCMFCGRCGWHPLEQCIEVTQ